MPDDETSTPATSTLQQWVEGGAESAPHSKYYLLRTRLTCIFYSCPRVPTDQWPHVRPRLTTHDRPEHGGRRDAALPQLRLKRLQRGDDLALVRGWLAAGLTLDHRSERLADDLAGVVVEAGRNLAPDKLLQGRREGYVHGAWGLPRLVTRICCPEQSLAIFVIAGQPASAGHRRA
jgi:hypothetical protein